MGTLSGFSFIYAAQGQDSGSQSPHPGTRAMVSLLKKLEGELRSVDNSYANIERAESLANALDQTQDPSEQLRIQFELARELLNGGYGKQAQSAFLGAFSVLFKNRAVVEDASLLEAWQRLAAAHMREAELANRVGDAGASCDILPLKSDSTMPGAASARASIEVLKALLKEFPEDIGSMYSLNIAYMLMGDFPSGVPEEYLLPVGEGQADFPRFANVASKWGLNRSSQAGSVVWEDFDDDGDLDLMTSSFGLGDPIRFFENQGKGAFADKTRDTGLMGLGGGVALVAADYDNDGDQDVFVVRGGNASEGAGDVPNSLLRNDGDGRFSDVTIEAGVFSKLPGQSAAWGDINLDGKLDLLIGNGSMPSLNPGKLGMVEEAFECELYLNLGDGKFREAAEEFGLVAQGDFEGVAIGDFDSDGDPDIFLSNSQGANVLYENSGPSGETAFRFVDKAEVLGVSQPDASHATWWFDYNNDGWLDLFVAGYSEAMAGHGGPAKAAALELWDLPREAERLWLYENDGAGGFRERASELSLERVAFARGCQFGDLDNDGFLDIYLSTGGLELSSLVPNRAFRNVQGGAFEEITLHGGFGHIGRGSQVAIGDFDQDGDADVYSVMGGLAQDDRLENALFENPGNGSHWIKVKLVGVDCARDALGARIEAKVESTGGTRSIFSLVDSGSSHGSAPHERVLGLGDAERVMDLRVRWPGEANDVSYGDFEVNRSVLIEQGQPQAQLR